METPSNFSKCLNCVGAGVVILLKLSHKAIYLIKLRTLNQSDINPIFLGWGIVSTLICCTSIGISKCVVKASAHSFKQFTSRLLKLSFSLSMHLYNSDERHAWFHLHGTSRPDRSASEATKYKMKNSLSTVGLEPSTLRFQVWRSTYWASRAWWMLNV